MISTVKIFLLNIWCYITNCSLIEITLGTADKWKMIKVVGNSKFGPSNNYYFSRPNGFHDNEFKLTYDGDILINRGKQNTY